jgi:DNA-binding transcriptional LysR family regulator
VEEFFGGKVNTHNTVAEMLLSEGACQMVANGSGVSIVEPFSAMGFSSEELVIKPIEPKLLFDVWLMYPTHRPMSKIAVDFAHFLDAELKRRLTRLRIGFRSFPMDLGQG